MLPAAVIKYEALMLRHSGQEPGRRIMLHYTLAALRPLAKVTAP